MKTKIVGHVIIVMGVINAVTANTTLAVLIVMKTANIVNIVSFAMLVCIVGYVMNALIVPCAKNVPIARIVFIVTD